MNALNNQPLTPEQFTIRPIAAQDDHAVEMLVVTTLHEFGCVGPGFASSDPEIKSLSTVYQTLPGQPVDCGYWVIVDKNTQKVYGGSGFSRLKGTTEQESICELQKVYFKPDLRGLGFGRKIIELCIQEAAQAGYKTMYLESMPQMKSALGIYEKFGFQYIPGPLGNTGHTSCTVFMSRALN